MSHLTCKCGHVIQDNTDDIPYKGHVIRDQERSKLQEGIVAVVTAFVEAASQGRRREWMDGFLRPGYDPNDWDNEAVVWAILTSQFLNRGLDVYQCEACGRLHVQAPGTDRFLSFSPDEGTGKDVLRVNAEMPNTT